MLPWDLPAPARSVLIALCAVAGVVVTVSDGVFPTWVRGAAITILTLGTAVGIVPPQVKTFNPNTEEVRPLPPGKQDAVERITP